VDILWALDNLTLKALLDIFLVALVFYGASFLIRGTQATTLLRGMLLALGALLIVSGLFNLVALRWLLENMLLVLGIALPVIFQPELRRALEQLGRVFSFGRRQAPDDDGKHRMMCGPGSSTKSARRRRSSRNAVTAP